MLVSLASILVNVAAASSMVKLAGLGHAGLALSTSLVALFGSVVLFELIRRRVGRLDGRRLTSAFWKISASSALMGVACALSSRLVQHWMGVSRLARVADLAVSVPVGLLVFLAAAKLFRLPELEAARRALIAPLTRRLGIGRAKI
jgi:putative peptidoglycan lipid II flippase